MKLARKNMINNKTFNQLFLYGLILAAFLAVFGSVLKQKAYVLAGMEKRLELQIKDKHHIIRWPGINFTANLGPKTKTEKIADPVTLNIPMQWLSPNPYLKRSGEIRSIYFVFAIPGPTPFMGVPVPLKLDPPEVKARFQEILKTRVLVTLNRDKIFRPADRAQLQKCDGKTKCMRESDVDGLERYTTINCYSPEELEREPIYQNNLRRKADDDLSPEGCVLNRGSQFLITPPETPKEQEVHIYCSDTHCSAYFMAGKRFATIFVSKENTYYHTDRLPKNPLLTEVFTDLPNWRQKVEGARKLIDGFVVNE